MLDDLFGDLRSLLHDPIKEHAWRGRFVELIERAYTLSPARYKAAWLPLLEDTAGAWQHHSIEHVQSVEELERWVHIAPFARCSLSLKDNDQMRAFVRATSLHEHVRDLDLYGSKHHKLDGDTIAAGLQSVRLPYLRDLTFQGVECDWTVVHDVLHSDRLPAVYKLNLSASTFHDTSYALRPRAGHASITHLHVNRCAAPKSALTDVMGRWEATRTLRSFFLTDTRSVDRPFEREYSVRLPCLETLYVDRMPIAREFIDAIGSSEHLGRLDTLVINDCGLVGSELYPFYAAPWHAPVDALDLSDNMTLDGDIEWLDATSLTHLESLNSNLTALHDESLELLASAPLLEQLTWLSVSDNLITDTGVLALARSHRIRHLKFLDLSMNAISQDAIDALGDSPHRHDALDVNVPKGLHWDP